MKKRDVHRRAVRQWEYQVKPIGHKKRKCAQWGRGGGGDDTCNHSLTMFIDRHELQELEVASEYQMMKNKTKRKPVGQICSHYSKYRPDDGAGHEQPATVIRYGCT